MNFEELKKIINEKDGMGLVELTKKKSREEIRINKEEIEEAIKKAVDGASTIILVTDIGEVICGSKILTMAGLSQLFDTLINKNGLTKEEIEHCLEMVEVKQKEDKMEELFEKFKKMMEGLED